MQWAWLYQILLKILGDVLTQYVLPLIKPTVKTDIEKYLPVAEKWVKAVETLGVPGARKYVDAFNAIDAELKKAGVDSPLEGLIDTAIQLAWVKLGLNERK